MYQAAASLAEQGGQTVSIDEMTGIQALERAAKTLPMKPGEVERREFEYIRRSCRRCLPQRRQRHGGMWSVTISTRTSQKA